jgi:penicillin-binding protein A
MAAAVALRRAPRRRSASPLAAVVVRVALVTVAGAPSRAAAQPQVDLDSVVGREGKLFANLDGGGVAELTLNPHLQQTLEEELDAHRLPFAAAVAISVPDGRVLALAGRSTIDPSLGAAELALRPWAPAASVFKVVAAAALVSQAQLSASTRACYHGGQSAVLLDNLVDAPRLDRCDTLAYAIGKSQNALIAKLAVRHLTPAGLGRVASAFGFGAPLPFDAPVEPSELDVPTDRLEFARTAAGFWHSSLSPLHGALLAATIANDGEMPAPRLVARAVDRDGRPLPLGRRASRRVLDPAVAREVGRMMELTTTMGTARTGFRDRRGRPYLPIDVAGKTGTLFYRGQLGDPEPPAAVLPAGGHLGYSWFVGFAPAQRPRVAFAVAIGNPMPWRVRAHVVARRLVAEYLAASAPPSEARPTRLIASR